jgi:hypothetical protein
MITLYISLLKLGSQADEEDLAFHPDHVEKPDRQIWLTGSSKLRSADREIYRKILSAADQAREEIVRYMNEHRLDLLMVRAGTCKAWFPCIGAITRLPVVGAHHSFVEVKKSLQVC